MARLWATAHPAIPAPIMATESLIAFNLSRSKGGLLLVENFATVIWRLRPNPGAFITSKPLVLRLRLKDPAAL